MAIPRCVWTEVEFDDRMRRIAAYEEEAKEAEEEITRLARRDGVDGA